MQKIALITDSCAGIPAQLAAENGIFVLPLIIRVNGKEYRADTELFPSDIYEILKSEIPKTSLPSAEDAHALLQHLTDQGYTHAIAIMLSGGLSGTANMLRVVGASFEQLKLTVWDSLSGSIGCGISLLEAASDIKAGKSYEEINSRIPSLLRNSHVFFSVDTLEYLQKGGRIGKITAIAASALQIKPILSFATDGQLVSVSKVRGKKMVLSSLCEHVKEFVTPGCKYNLMVADGGDPETGKILHDQMKSLFPDYNMCIYTNIDSTLSCYIGPGVLGAGIQILE